MSINSLIGYVTLTRLSKCYIAGNPFSWGSKLQVADLSPTKTVLYRIIWETIYASRSLHISTSHILLFVWLLP